MILSNILRLLKARAAFVVPALVTVVIGLSLPLSSWYGSLRERMFDGVVASLERPTQSEQVVVVDIDRVTLEALGGWPLGRDRLAELIAAVAVETPAVIALDVLLDGPDEQSPAALARKLARRVDSAAVAALAVTLPDGDVQLAQTLAAAKVVLGAALDPGRTTVGGLGRPILTRGTFDDAALWQEPGAVGPPVGLADVAAGIGALVLPGEADGSIRRVPMIVVAGNRLLPGLALEVLRVARDVPLIALQAAPRRVLLGTTALPLDDDGMLRLRPPTPNLWPRRTISAGSLLAGQRSPITLGGRIVLIGSSAPEVGGLRPLPTGELVASVQLQADATVQLLDGSVPLRPPLVGVIEALALMVAAVLAAVAGVHLSPMRAAFMTVGIGVAWLLSVAAAFVGSRLLVDPLLVPASAAISFMLAALARAAATARRETAIRQRFEQHLAPAVVRQIIAQPDALKLEGEVRVITAFFTDVEDFTALTDRAEPRALIAVLDAYFDGVIRVVIEHGGLVDKIVGDAVHAIFNAPFDLPEHPRRAVDCAIAVAAFAEKFRLEPLPAALKFGRTRIGVETGTAIVGDVGGARKLDYTAHGNAVNAAARLEAANKLLGTTIAIGPGTARELPADMLQPLGLIELRGRADMQHVCSLWPSAWSEADRESWRLALVAKTPHQTLEGLVALTTAYPDERSLQQLLVRMRRATDRSVSAPADDV